MRQIALNKQGIRIKFESTFQVSDGLIELLLFQKMPSGDIKKVLTGYNGINTVRKVHFVIGIQPSSWAM